MEQKQEILAEPDVNKRLQLMLSVLGQASEMAKIDENTPRESPRIGRKEPKRVLPSREDESD
jgi:hypothetical protein